MKSAFVASSIILVSALIAGCGSPEPLPTPGQTSVEFPVGRFAGGLGDEFMFFENGKFEHYFQPTGNQVQNSGTYTVTGDQITIINTYGSCVGEDEGLYSWTFDGETLDFSVLRDLCSMRKDIIGNYSYDLISGD